MPHPARPRPAGRTRALAAPARRPGHWHPALATAGALLRPTPSRIALLAVTASLLVSLGTLTACGGGELAILGYIGAAGGSYVLEDMPGQNGLAQRGCAVGACTLALGTVPPGLFNNLYQSSYTVQIVNGSLGTGTACTTNALGTADGAQLTIPGCFTGRFRNVTEAIASDGKTLLRLSSYTHDFDSGAWTDLEQPGYRVKFRADANGATATGCEFNNSNAVTGPASLTYTDATASSPPAVTAVTLNGVTWTAEMVGRSGLKLTRAGSVKQLERRVSTDVCN